MQNEVVSAPLPEKVQFVASELTRIIDGFGPTSGVRMVTPQAGCHEGCSFCSQNAFATSTKMFNPDGLELLFSALTNLNGQMPYVRNIDGPNQGKPIITAHYDNDVGSYPDLAQYLYHVNKMGAVARLSTVGWSRHNQDLQAMHEAIVADPETRDAIHKIRFSFQPFTMGARGIRGLSLEETLKDIKNTLRTYKPFIENREKDDAIMELRYFPNVILSEVNISEKQVAFGPYKVNFDSDLTDPEHGYACKTALLSGPEYEVPIPVVIAKLTNADGEFYDITTTKDPNLDIGIERSIQIFPKTSSRKNTGYIENTSFFHEYLNVTNKGNSPSWENISQALTGISIFAAKIQPGNPELAEKLFTNVLPWALRYVKCIYDAGLNPEFVYRDFGNAIGHETILNHGRALTLFRGLASRNTPMSLFEYFNYDTHIGTIGSQLPQVRISPHEHGIQVSLHDSATFKPIRSEIIEIEGLTKPTKLATALRQGLLIGAGSLKA